MFFSWGSVKGMRLFLSRNIASSGLLSITQLSISVSTILEYDLCANG